MFINKTSTVEFYRIELTEDNSTLAADLKEYSSNILDFYGRDGLVIVFKHIKTHMEDKTKREKTIRNKKHKLWLDVIKQDVICGFATKENQNGAIIDKESFEITLAQDEKIDFELASLSHFVIDTNSGILALETFAGGVSKTGLHTYLNDALCYEKQSIKLTPIPRDDLEQILNDVKNILKFKAKYRDIKHAYPDFLDAVFNEKSKAIKLAQQIKTYEASITIDFGEGEKITQEDTIIQKLIKTVLNRDLDDEFMIDGRVELLTNSGSEELIDMHENIFVEKMKVTIDEQVATREAYSSIFYDSVKSKIDALIGKLSQ